MHDGKALQSGTSHNFGDGFAKAFGIQYSDKDNQLKYVHQTSWGMTTRMIGAIIMVHGDNEGLVLPPNVAPTQVVIVPIRQQQEGVLEKAREVEAVLSNFRVKVDDSDKSPGWKFSESEMRGIPVRVELGPKDIEAGQAVLVRRDTHEKITVALSEIAEKVDELLKTIQHDMYERAKAHRDAHTYDAHNMEEMKDIADNKPGFIRAMWCGCQECEDKLKEQVGVTSRCMPFKQEKLAETCVCCGKPATRWFTGAKHINEAMEYQGSDARRAVYSPHRVGAFLKITIPVQPVPMHFTLQFFFVLLAALLLGSKRAFASVLTYLVIGLCGIPVFATGGGPAYLLNLHSAF